MVTVDGLDQDTIAETYTYQYSDSRQVLSRDETTNAVEFTSDIVLDDLEQLRVQHLLMMLRVVPKISLV